MHGDEYVLLDYLKHWLPMNHSDHPELPSSGERIRGDIARKKTTPTMIRKASHYSKIPRQDTTTQSDASKRLPVDFVGDSEEPNMRIVRGKTRGFC